MKLLATGSRAKHTGKGAAELILLTHMHETSSPELIDSEKDSSMFGELLAHDRMLTINNT